MSDKNKNMNDINDQKTAEQQAFSEEIRRRLAEPGSGKPTLDEFKVMVYKDREKRRKKRNALVACLVAAFIVGYLTYDDLVPEVGADKNPKETIQTEDGVIIEDGGWGSSKEDNVIVLNEVEHIGIARNIVPNILIPEYSGKNYKFKKLLIDTSEDNLVRCEYIYKKKNNLLKMELIINNSSYTSFSINNVTRILDSKKGEIYIQEADNKIATIQIDDGITFYVIGSIPDEEIIKIVESLEN